MLPEKLLEELTRSTALSQYLVEMAWPRLSDMARTPFLHAFITGPDG